ncbi:NADPH-dependent FMN reductase [Streptomyces sp. NPDC053079]|uniref:NADPH-dependent FMN reductase n=1 Tax=Streptomyces sp. NPDC053079 TaxID=3365697 RepID=UPI0037CDD639
MRALLISGSPNPRSATTALAGVAGRALGELGATVHTVNLAEHPDPATLHRAVAHAGAIVLASPVHHAGYSGLLKTALDTLPGDAFADKAVGLLAHGSGPRTGNVVCEQLRTVAKALGGWVVPTQVAACREDFTAADGPADPLAPLLARCRTMAAELHRCATMLDVSALEEGKASCTT